MKRLWRGLLLGTFLATATTALADVAPLGPMPPQSSAQREAGRRRLEELRARAAALASAAASAGIALPSASSLPSALPSASASAPAVQLAIKWAEQVASRGVRRDQHRHALVDELGAQLGDPAVNAELVLHARRVAELSRSEFLAKNARSGAAQAQLLARIKKLTAREDARHRAALAKLTKPAGPLPSGSAATSASAPSSAAPSASGAHR